MKLDRLDLVEALSKNMEADVDTLRNEVAVEEIVEYCHGELHGQRAERVRDLLSTDPELARVVLESRDPRAKAAMEQTSSADQEEIESNWRDLLSRLESDVSSEPDLDTRVEVFSTVPEQRSLRTSPAYKYWAIAASFLIGCLATSLIFLTQQRPSLNDDARSEVRLVLLEPLRVDAGATLGPEEAQARSASRDALVIIELLPPTTLERTGPLPKNATARLYFRDVSTTQTDHRGILVLEPKANLQEDVYVVSLASESLEPGAYWIELLDTQSQTIANYRFRWE